MADLLNEHRGEGDEALLDAMEAQVKALKDYLARTRKADDYWIECECPVTQGDWDEETIGSPDTMFGCPHCGGEHRAGDVGRLAATRDGSLEVRWFTEEEWRHLTTGRATPPADQCQ